MVRPTSPTATIQHQAVEFLLYLNDFPEDDAARARLERWLEADPAHGRAWAKARRAWAATAEAPAPARAQPMRRPRDRAWAVRPQARRLAALAALLLVALMVALVLGRDDWRAGPDGVAEALLEDGSRVVLDSGSGLDVGFHAGQREVSLTRGEALFQVAHDPARPFRVRVGEVTVTVLGTVFDIRLDDEVVAVAVASGRVRVDGADGRHTELIPGESLRIDRRDGAWSAGAIDVGAIAAWRDGKLVVDDASLAQVVQALNRHSRGRVAIGDPALAARRITGVFDLRHPAAALRAAAAPHGGVVRDWGGWLLTLDAK